MTTISAMREIQLSHGKVALVDDDDFDYLNQFRWYYRPDGYAARNIRIGGVKKNLLMHRVIMKTPIGKSTDHKNGDTLNNQKDNLRVCTPAQNNMNMRKRRNAKSKYKGVVLCSRGVKKNFVMVLQINGRRISKTMPFTPEGELMAAKAYNQLARKYFGEFARLNQV